MAIADQITELTTIRGDIRTALTGKGVSASDHNFADFASDIDAIPSGGGGIKYDGYTFFATKINLDWSDGNGSI